MKSPADLLPHLFRTEYRKIIAVLCRRFGFDQLEIAEDIASETFLTATQTWGVKGLPPKPVAWLYEVAKNKARNHLRRTALFEKEVLPAIAAGIASYIDDEVDLSPEIINDSQLQMMFAVCHPSISPEAQVGLSLRVLCGFGIEEIASAFLSNKETINKRLTRARQKLREEGIVMELPGPAEMDERLETVLTTLYLLFNEGYYSYHEDGTLRKELCFEAMRLCTMLVENQSTNKPPVNALLSLMCFHASRFDARMDQNGEIILYDDQDPSLWNADLIGKGSYFLQQAVLGRQFSKYQLEAAVAYWSTQHEDSPEKWENVLDLYDRLLELAYSPAVALNRTWALFKVKGRQCALQEAEKLELVANPFYYSLLGELLIGVDNDRALVNFRRAEELSNSNAVKNSLRKKITVCSGG